MMASIGWVLVRYERAPISSSRTRRRSEDASQYLDRIVWRLLETIHLARLDGNEVVYLVTRRSPHSIAILIPPGRRMPAHVTALGKALLAARPWPLVESSVPRAVEHLTDQTITSRDKFAREFRTDGRAGLRDRSPESDEGVHCIVALDLHSPPLYAISCSIPMLRLLAELEGRAIAGLLEVKKRLK